MDLDDTLACTDERIRACVRKEFSPKVELNRTSIDWNSAFPEISSKELSEFLWNDEGKKVFDYKEIKPKIDAPSFLYWLQQLDLEIILVSANPVKSYVRKWPLWWNLDSYIDDVICDWKKENISAQYAVEDDYRFANALADSGKFTILIDKPYNKAVIETANLVRVTGYYQLIQAANIIKRHLEKT